MTVTMYSKKGCGSCIATEKVLSLRGIKYDKVMIDEDLEKQDELRAAGYMEMPVVRLEKAGQKVLEFAGFSDKKINELRNQLAS